MYADIEIYKTDDNIYIARCSELKLYAKGNTQKEAVTKLKKKIMKFIRASELSVNAKQDIDYTTHYYSARFPQTH